MPTSILDHRMPVLYLSHGGGPWPYLDGAFRSHFAWMEAALRDIPRQLPAPPTAVLVISGHWEEAEFTVSSSPAPGMVYDYFGFPESTYHIVYPAPGSPALAERVAGLLADASWPARSDPARGFDHGTFSMLKPMYPQADVPVVQLSLKHGLDAQEHLAIGRALAPLRDEGVLIIGSGQSYHNLRNLGRSGTAPSAAFDEWMRDVLLYRDPNARWSSLVGWREAPSAQQAHPREDHLLPLMVATGAAGNDPATCIYGELLWGHIHVSSYRFGLDRTSTGFDRLAQESS
jgi:aromatic ring-opening dioxygenase catalytic subunit (LigB family)